MLCLSVKGRLETLVRLVWLEQLAALDSRDNKDNLDPGDGLDLREALVEVVHWDVPVRSARPETQVNILLKFNFYFVPLLFLLSAVLTTVLFFAEFLFLRECDNS